MADAPSQQMDPAALMRTRAYRRLLILAAVIGVIVSLASWLFLEGTHALQQWTYETLPTWLGFAQAPWWWPLPVLAVAGVAIAFAVVRLPGHGGHDPSQGLATGPPITAAMVPGVVLAAVATLGFGMVLGPEAPLIGIATGVALWVAGRSRKPVPDQALVVIAAAGSFAALATIFGSPIVGAVIIIEAAALGGATLPLVLLPGLIAAGIGSLVFVGVGSLTGLSSSAYALPPLALPEYPTPQLTDFLWTIVLSLVTAGVVFVVMALGRRTRDVVARRPYVFHPAAAVLVGLVAVAFAALTGQSANAVLFSGQEEMSATVQTASTLTLATLALLLIAKALAWGISMGAARGGPTFPAMFLGVVGGLLAAHLPGFAETPAIGVLVGAACVAVLRLPLSSIILALLITQAGAGVAPLIIVGVAVAYLATLLLADRRAKPVVTPAVA
ncbi:MAG: chloride channel protein [Actinobacteria bacterium]|nr:chloride channel protein [Actinomycetota bacterium]